MSAEHFLNDKFRAMRLKKADTRAYAKLTGCDPIEASRKLVDLAIDGGLIAERRKVSPFLIKHRYGLRTGTSRIEAAKAVLSSRII